MRVVVKGLMKVAVNIADHFLLLLVKTIANVIGSNRVFYLFAAIFFKDHLAINVKYHVISVY